MERSICKFLILALFFTTSMPVMSRQIKTDNIRFNQISTPSSPSSGKNRLYFKADNQLYQLNSSGPEALVGGGGSGGSIVNGDFTELLKDKMSFNTATPEITASGNILNLTTTDQASQTGTLNITTGSPTTVGTTHGSGIIILGTGDVGNGNTSTGSGQVLIQSGVTTSANSPSGFITIRSGDAGANNSGSITLRTGTSSATRGPIIFQNGSESGIGQTWVSIGNDGQGAWSDSLVANTALSNLDSGGQGIEQEYSIGGDDLGVPAAKVSTRFIHSQVFTASSTYDLSSVTVRLRRISGHVGSNVTGSIRATDGNDKPSGVILKTSVAFDTSTISDSTYSDVDIVFSPAFAVTSGVKYSFELTGDDIEASNGNEWAADGSFAGGIAPSYEILIIGGPPGLDDPLIGTNWLAVGNTYVTKYNVITTPTTINASLIPDTDETYDLGTSSLKWNDLNTKLINGKDINDGVTYSAVIANPGIVLEEIGGDWIDGNCTSGDIQVCTFNSGFFTPGNNTKQSCNVIMKNVPATCYITSLTGDALGFTCLSLDGAELPLTGSSIKYVICHAKIE